MKNRNDWPVEAGKGVEKFYCRDMRLSGFLHNPGIEEITKDTELIEHDVSRSTLLYTYSTGFRRAPTDQN